LILKIQTILYDIDGRLAGYGNGIEFSHKIVFSNQKQSTACPQHCYIMFQIQQNELTFLKKKKILIINQ